MVITKIKEYSLTNKCLQRITIKGSQTSPRMSGNLWRFAIRGGLIRGLVPRDLWDENIANLVISIG